MNQKIWSSLSAAVFTTVLASIAPAQAEVAPVVNAASMAKPSVTPEGSQSVNSSAPSSVRPDTEALKVGSYSSFRPSREQIAPNASEAAKAVARILPHEMGQSEAATLYVHNIPVFTFLGGPIAVPQELKMGSRASDSSLDQRDPVQRASRVAALINQLAANDMDAKQILVRWNRDRRTYTIHIGEQDLVEMNSQNRLPDTTRNLTADALQATNRLRRLLGNAAPLAKIPGKPRVVAPAIAFTNIRLQMSGIASWYGPGFHGNRSANGEIYNQNALTAAHRNLPFGTRVRVTNLNNGRSVIVRINDRGPFTRGRVIDLSAAAAQAIGMVQTGVAPVRLDVMAPPQTVAIDEQ